MNHRALSPLLGGLALLACVLLLEVAMPPAAPPAAAPPALAQPAFGPPAAAGPARLLAGHEEAMRSILARPLFAASRRPPPAEAGAPRPAAADASLPRLSGIVISRGERRAILVPAGGSKPLTLSTGGKLGAWSLETIETDHVVLRGEDGSHALRLSYRGPATSEAAGPPGLARAEASLPPLFPGGIAEATPGAAPIGLRRGGIAKADGFGPDITR